MPLRILLWICLALALSLSGAMRSSMLAMTGFQQVEICANGHSQTLLLDRAGNPTKEAPACWQCPDCLQSPLALVSALPESHRVMTARAFQTHPMRRRQLPRGQRRLPQPRGPPPIPRIRPLLYRFYWFFLPCLTLIKDDTKDQWHATGCIQMDTRR